MLVWKDMAAQTAQRTLMTAHLSLVPTEAHALMLLLPIRANAQQAGQTATAKLISTNVGLKSADMLLATVLLRAKMVPHARTWSDYSTARVYQGSVVTIVALMLMSVHQVRARMVVNAVKQSTPTCAVATMAGAARTVKSMSMNATLTLAIPTGPVPTRLMHTNAPVQTDGKG